MHYKEVLDRVIHAHHQSWGGFYDGFPSLDGLTLLQLQATLKEQGEFIYGYFKRNEIHFAEIIALAQGLETITLLYVIVIWASVSESIPITDDDIEEMKSIFNSLAAAGVHEDKEIIDFTRELIEKGLKLRTLPEDIKLLLPNPEMYITTE